MNAYIHVPICIPAYVFAWTIWMQVSICMEMHIHTCLDVYQAFIYPCISVCKNCGLCVLVAVFSLLGLSQRALINILQALSTLDAEVREGDAG